ncbi:MAG: hypothetical protein J1E61_08265 [Lachnospiraceae bacterium]|nr:hypothetical protein [Lachnospiraceae bacterium]
METVTFGPEEKVEFFDAIADRYFNRNFGTMLKADIDTLIFSTYIEHCLKKGLPYDDYSLSNSLGITESRVRSLKERKQLQYPYENYNWKDAFIDLIPNAKYNDVKKLVQINIGDVNLMKDVRHFVYENGWFDEFQLNPRLFQCRLDYFLALCYKLDEIDGVGDDVKEKILELAKNEQEKSALKKIASGAFEDGIKALLVAGAKVTIAQVLALIPFGAALQKGINMLIEKL